jgi:hypothetical protein
MLSSPPVFRLRHGQQSFLFTKLRQCRVSQFPSPAGSSSSTSSIRTQHQYYLTHGKGKGNDRPWLTLRVSSRSPKSKLLPLFIGKDSISGIVELELAKPETVREVKVTVSVVSDLHRNRLTTE